MDATTMGAKVHGALVRARIARNLSQEVVAARLHMSRGHFCRIENSHAQATFDELFRWAAIVGVEVCAQPITSGVKE